jgi:hypothetical protein
MDFRIPGLLAVLEMFGNAFFTAFFRISPSLPTVAGKGRFSGA